jgi:hypothetical protein
MVDLFFMLRVFILIVEIWRAVYLSFILHFASNAFLSLPEYIKNAGWLSFLNPTCRLMGPKLNLTFKFIA